ncbi:MAG: membrane protein insertase YidC [Candidatus Acidiferrales bacterium]
MSDQVRGVLFVIVSLLILFAWGHFYKPPAPPPQTQPNQTQTSAPVSPSGTQQGATQAGGAGNAPGKANSTVKAAAPANPSVVEASEEKNVVVESPLYHVELSNRGGVVKTWELKKYMNDEKPPRPLDLVNDSVAKELGWPFSLVLADSQLEAKANSALYQVQAVRGDVVTAEKTGAGAGSKAATRAAASAAAAASELGVGSSSLEAPIKIIFHWSDGHLDVTKTLNFTANYEMTVEVSVLLDGKPEPVAVAWRGGFGDKAVYNAAQLVTVYYKTGGKLTLLQYKKLGVSGNQGQPAVQNGPLEFAGIEDQFFTAAFLPDGTDISLWHWMQNHEVTADGKQTSLPEAEMGAGTTAAAPLRVRLYIGPKELRQLEELRPSLGELVNFGWTGVIAKPLLWILQTLHTKVPNWGWCIVLMTLVINLAMFPLKMKSWRSMQKMQKVAPEIRQIQDRYKKYSMSDTRKKKMNEEVMAVYSREGINPMGSCLPMVFQMPIWWALWRVLGGAIELRHAPWLGWIHDLSAMDPYYILPIGMTIMMYLMTKMTPQTTVDPAQQKMMTLMPLMMGFIFFRLSSGLNLYMFTSNLVGIGQQYYLNKTDPLPSKSKFKKKEKVIDA